MSHAVGWFEVSGKDHHGLRDFYTTLFGWKAQDVDGMPYSMVAAEEGGIAGGIGASPDGSTNVTFYVQADDLQAVLDRVGELGGRTVMPVTQLPETTIARFADPEGNVVGLYRM